MSKEFPKLIDVGESVPPPFGQIAICTGERSSISLGFKKMISQTDRRRQVGLSATCRI